MQARSCLVFLAMLAALVSLCGPAPALVGDAGPADIAIQRYTIVVYSVKGRCSGVVLAQDLVLTAAHCVEADEETYFVAGRVGVHTFVKGTVTMVARHPEFRKAKTSFDADLAVMKLAEPPSGYFMPAYLQARPVNVGDRVIVGGYGKANQQDADIYATMRSAALVVLQRRSAAQVVLASADGLPSGSCRGDSGGPVFTYRGLFALVGIMVSGNCETLTTTVALSHHYDWIVEAARKLGSPLN